MEAIRYVMAAAVAAAVCGVGGVAAADPAKPDAAAAKAEFDAASNEMKDLVAELTVLQAQYHQPKADKAVV